jgi:dTDP-4-dehydrorhamnose reductase
MPIKKNKIKPLNILVLGANGMLVHSVYSTLSEDANFKVFGTIRNPSSTKFYTSKLAKNLIPNIDVENYESLIGAFITANPDVVINCVGIIKQLSDSEDALKTVPINTLLPHRLALLSKIFKSRLILVSTDCVFSGEKGDYLETDYPDCKDLYGRSKLLGEITNQKNVLTIRTSIIGHELRGGLSLVDWFLSQKKSVHGFSNAIFSGLPTNELAKIIKVIIMKHKNLFGLYHIAAQPISKFDLLQLIAKIYGLKTKIIKSDAFKINRSLNHGKFSIATGYKPKNWELLIRELKRSSDHRQKI